MYSIIVTTRRGIDTIRSLFDVSRNDVELIIIDSNYNSFTFDELKKIPHQFKQVVYAPLKKREQNKKYNMINALNTGFLYAEGDWLIRVDDNTDLAPNFFEKLDETLKVLSYRGDTRFVIRQLELEEDMKDTKWNTFINGPHFRYYQLPTYPIGRTIPIQTAGLCIMHRTTMYDLNGVDERYDDGLSWTDNDMFVRILAAGYQWVLDTELMIFRRHHESSGVGEPREINKKLFMDIFENEFKKGVYKSKNSFNFEELNKTMLLSKKQYIINYDMEKSIYAYWENRTPMTWGNYDEMRRLRYSLQDYMHRTFDFMKWKGKRVLEVGCGAGIDALEFAKYGAEVWATDMTDKAVNHAKEFVKEQNPMTIGGKVVSSGPGVQTGSITVEKANALSLPYQDNFFDLVFCFGVLHHNPHPEKMLKEFERVLKPGGSCYVTVYNRESMLYYYSILWLRGIEQEGFKKGETEQSLLSRYSEGKEGCPYTKAYTKSEAYRLFGSFFRDVELSVEYPVVDTLEQRKVKLPSLPKDLGWHLVIKAVKP